MNTKYLSLPPKVRRNVKAQVSAIKLAINEAIPVNSDRTCIVIALSELIAEFMIEQNPQGLAK